MQRPPMLVLVALLSSFQLKGEPLDRFRANHTLIRANVEFTERTGMADREIVGKGLLWEGEITLKENPALSVSGRWECDGTSEHLICGPTDEAEKLRPKPKKSGDVVAGIPRYEHLTDGEFDAYHFLGDGSPIVLIPTKATSFVHHGPFYFDGLEFAAALDRVYKDAKPDVRKTAVHGGHPGEVVVYRSVGDSKYLRELMYDPSIGYLPRFTRAIYRKERTATRFEVTETYLTEARKCAAGGFVPTEWYMVSYSVENFDASYPDYNDETVLIPTGRQVSVTHFKATKFEDRTGPVRLDHIDGVHGVVGNGGTLPLRNDPKSLTLAEAKVLLGRRLTERRAVILPNIDQRELHEFDEDPRRPGWIYAAVVGVGVALVVGYFFRIRRLR